MHSLAVRRAALVATRAASPSSSTSSSGSCSSSRRALSSRSALSSSSATSSQLPFSLCRSPFPPSPLRPPLCSPRCHRQQHFRCYASRKEEDKSWGEIAGDAAEVAKGALKKLSLGALTAVEKVFGGGGKKPSPPSTPSTRQQPRPGDEGDGDSFWGPMGRSDRGGGGPLAGSSGISGGGLLGSLVGGVLGRAVQGAMGAIAEQSRLAGALADSALADANGDAAVREEFGGELRRSSAGVGGGVAQSSSTVVVNGRARKSSSVSFPVAGPRGAGFLEATSVSSDGGAGASEVVVRVRSQRGKVLVVGGNGGGGGGGGGSGRGGGGDVIDIDFREVS